MYYQPKVQYQPKSRIQMICSNKRQTLYDNRFLAWDISIQNVPGSTVLLGTQPSPNMRQCNNITTQNPTVQHI